MIDINLSNLDGETIAKLIDKYYWNLRHHMTGYEKETLRNLSNKIKEALDVHSLSTKARNEK